MTIKTQKEPVEPIDLNVRRLADTMPLQNRILSIYEPKTGLLPYFIYLPEKPDPLLAPIVAVHGWKRNAAEHIFLLSKMAEERGAVLIAPLFSRQHHRHYQRLKIGPDETCPVDALDRMLIDASHRFCLATGQVNLFGFSGGAQFAHRYTMMRSEKVRKLALMAAGWYTMPDDTVRYPYGVAPSKMLAGRELAIEGLLACPTFVLVGSADSGRDESLKVTRRLDRTQGKTRVARARSWVRAMKQAAQDRGIDALYELHLIKRASHNFGACVHKHHLDRLIFDWFTPDHEGERP